MQDDKNIKNLRKTMPDILQCIPEITLVYLFGSQAGGHVGPLSDYDLGVLVAQPESAPYVRSRLAFELGRKTATTKIDIVMLNRAAVELAFAVISRGKLLYQRGDAERIEYEAKIMGLYYDYLPVLRSQSDDILRGGEYEARIHRYREAFGRTVRTLGEIRTSEEFARSLAPIVGFRNILVQEYLGINWDEVYKNLQETDGFVRIAEIVRGWLLRKIDQKQGAS